MAMNIIWDQGRATGKWYCVSQNHYDVLAIIYDIAPYRVRWNIKGVDGTLEEGIDSGSIEDIKTMVENKVRQIYES